MARVTAPVRPAPPAERPRGDRVRWDVIVIVGAVVLVAGVWLGPFLIDASRMPPGPDMAWYTWRSEVLTARPPAELILADGPLRVFGGGYRVGTPLLGALFRSVAGVDRYTVSILLIALRQVLLAAAMGAVAYRIVPRRFAVAAVTVTSGAILLLRPFVGYVDNLLALLFSAAALWFLTRAGREWPARIVVAAAAFLMVFTHPPTAAIFAGVVVASVAVRAVLGGGLRETIRTEGWIAGAVIVGVAAGTLAWVAGIWGPSRGFRDAIHLPPYALTTYRHAAAEQVRGLRLTWMVVPFLAGLTGLAMVLRRRLLDEPLPRTLVVGLAPLAGVLGFLVGFRYPFQRFVTSTVAPIVVVGLGVWFVAAGTAWLGRRMSSVRRGIAVGVGTLAGVAVIGQIWAGGSDAFGNQDPWVPDNLRVNLAAVRTYLEDDPTPRPLVFVVSAGSDRPDRLIWGGVFRGNWSQTRAGLPARAILDTHLYLGSVDQLLRGRPTRTKNRLTNLINRETLREVRPIVRERRPLVVLLRRFNRRMGNFRYLTPSHSVPLGRNVFVLKGPGLAEPESAAVKAAALAATREAASLKGVRSFRPLHAARVTVALGILLLLPGLLLARGLGVRGLPALLGMVPVLSIGVELLVGIALLAVLRRPVTPLMGWAIVAVSVGLGWLLARRAGAPTADERGDGQPPQDHR
ncbi:MAG TPA: hypothetical protein VE754_02285 [Actinomycetota bacterium]|nr:hypothetical protein [Actinomycetota bacterium]